MDGTINPINREFLREFLREEIFNKNNEIIKLYRDDVLQGAIIEDYDINLIWPKPESRFHWIEIIKNNPNYDKCIMTYENKLKGKRDKIWLKKYHDLYYSLKNEGYSNKYFPITGIDMGNGTIYRLDGTHRCSCLHDLGYKNIRVLIFKLEDIMNLFENINNKFEEFILSEYPDYQEFRGKIEPKTKERYENLINITRKYHRKGIMSDIGCNAGYFCSLLSDEDNCQKVYGIDISELDIEAAKILTKKNSNNPDKIEFCLGHAHHYPEVIKRCDVVFFLRSIYHLGIGAKKVLEMMNVGTRVIIECNRGQRKKIPNPEVILPTIGKRLALVDNLVPFLENNNFEINDILFNVDDVVIATKIK